MRAGPILTEPIHIVDGMNQPGSGVSWDPDAVKQLHRMRAA
jgi:hypothetical protein